MTTQTLQLIVIPAALVALFMFSMPWVFMLIRNKFAKMVEGSVWVEWWPSAGYVKHEFIKLNQNGMLLLPKKKNVRAREYAISDLAVRPIMYPQFWPRAIQVTAQTAAFDSESYEPISNRSGLLTLSPIRSADIHDGNVMSAGIEKLNEENEQSKQPLRQGTSPILWILVVIVLIAAAGVAFYMYGQNKGLDESKAALGIQTISALFWGL